MKVINWKVEGTMKSTRFGKSSTIGCCFITKNSLGHFTKWWIFWPDLVWSFFSLCYDKWFEKYSATNVFWEFWKSKIWVFCNKNGQFGVAFRSQNIHHQNSTMAKGGGIMNITPAGQEVLLRIGILSLICVLGASPSFTSLPVTPLTLFPFDLCIDPSFFIWKQHLQPDYLPSFDSRVSFTRFVLGNWLIRHLTWWSITTFHF